LGRYIALQSSLFISRVRDINSSGPFAQFANCIIASAFYVLRKKERKREKERYSPLFSIRDRGLSPYILGSVDSRRMRRTLTPCTVESGRRRRRVKDFFSLSLSLSLSLTPRGTRAGPTFDLYRPLSIFCNLLLRILNVRITSDTRA